MGPIFAADLRLRNTHPQFIGHVCRNLSMVFGHLMLPCLNDMANIRILVVLVFLHFKFAIFGSVLSSVGE